MNTDTIADFLTRVRNASAANHRVVEIPASNLKKAMTKILFDQGYILSYKFVEGKAQDTIKIALKYDRITKEAVIKDIQRISKPGLRKYSSSSEIPRILNGFKQASKCRWGPQNFIFLKLYIFLKKIQAN